MSDQSADREIRELRAQVAALEQQKETQGRAVREQSGQLERSLAGISPRTLSLRLRALEEQGIVERHTFPEVPPRVEYALTDKGLALLPIVDDMRAYGEDWLGAECAPGPELDPQTLIVA